ncbi:MAG TPA: transketolase [Cytophagales bacterium]|nr:transketolase [Cytophagales bacterium]
MAVTKKLKIGLSVDQILKDYHTAIASREASLIGRKEVFSGKAKFGIFGDGKEVAQLAMARSFQNGDFRSGYYRDQTFMLAIGQLTLQQYFAQLYAHTDVEAEPASAGRMMNGHFANRLLNDQGDWLPQTSMKNSSSDISPTAAQMPRMLGLAYASKLYRNSEALQAFEDFSKNGNEISWGTIGNASTSEGMFYEAINAAGVLKVPMLMSVWDDDYGISVPKEYHTTKGSIGEVLAGFQREGEGESGYEMYTVRGWDYEALVDTYETASDICRTGHVPVLVHVVEMTQPQGHSTSGSHERYKSKDRLAWESEYDCIRQMRLWIEENELATAEQLDEIELTAKTEAKEARKAAWNAFIGAVKQDQNAAVMYLQQAAEQSPQKEAILGLVQDLKGELNPIRKNAISAAKKALRLMRGEASGAKQELISWLQRAEEANHNRYSSHVTSQSSDSPLKVPHIPAVYSEDSQVLEGFKVLQHCFDNLLEQDPRVFAIGEDLGKIGGVNQGMAGLQEKHGLNRVTDTGIRECTILGQGIGAALRGLRPITEIQYLDYLLYALQIMSDDLATLQYRTKGGQKSPVVIRTRGHRLEGIWHTGSPMGMILHSIRGIHVCVPRNMVQAAGMYNTLMQGDDPALLIECLNGYRLKETLPDNYREFTVPLGQPEVIREGTDVTIVTYGSMCRIVMAAAEQLAQLGISCEVIDVQTLLPFDLNHKIVESLKKTNRLVVADEDVPGGASAFILQQVLEVQDGYHHLDSKPLTIAAKEHRAAYSSDGDYFSKPSEDSVLDGVYGMMHEVAPTQFPEFYK